MRIYPRILAALLLIGAFLFPISAHALPTITFSDGTKSLTQPLMVTFPNIVSTSDPETIIKIQAVLWQNGYFAGPINGVYGPDTQEAIEAFQEDQGLPTTTRLTTDTINSVVQTAKHLGICANGQQYFFVVKPKNNNNTYTPNKTILVRWRSCNIPSSSNVAISVSLPNHAPITLMARNGDHHATVSVPDAYGIYKAQLQTTISRPSSTTVVEQ